MKFDNRTTELIALGASVAANCQSCLEYHLGKARESGIEPEDVAQAIEIGRTVRAGAAARVDAVAGGRPDGRPSATAANPADGCASGSWRSSGCCPR